MANYRKSLKIFANSYAQFPETTNWSGLSDGQHTKRQFSFSLMLILLKLRLKKCFIWFLTPQN